MAIEELSGRFRIEPERPSFYQQGYGHGINGGHDGGGFGDGRWGFSGDGDGFSFGANIKGDGGTNNLNLDNCPALLLCIDPTDLRCRIINALVQPVFKERA